MGGAQPNGGVTTDGNGANEGAQDEASAAGGKPTQGQGGAGSVNERGPPQQETSSKPSEGQAQGSAGKAGGGMQNYAGNLVQQFQGSLPEDSEGHLNSAMNSANSAVSLICVVLSSFFSGLVSFIASPERVTFVKVIY